MKHDVQKAVWDSGDDDQEMRRAMVEFELEAAEALAGLARSSVVKDEEEGHHDDDGDHSMPAEQAGDENVLHPPVQMVYYQSMLQEDAGAATVIQPEEGMKTIINPVKLDDEQHQEQFSISFRVKSAASGGKSRQPLTESEKEEKKLRRVMANRESARQTIRRRQAMFEELTRKASDLVRENENLKRELELAMKAYNSLKSTNDCLKEQMAELEADAVREGTESVPTEGSASSSTPGLPVDQPSVVPLHWHSMMQPMVQSQSRNDSATPSIFPVTETWRPYMFMDQRSCTNIPNPGALLYLLPWPCFFPWRSPLDVAFPQPFNLIERQTLSQMSSQCSADFPCQSALSSLINRESCPIVTKPGGDSHQAGFMILQERHPKPEGTQPDPAILMPTPLSCISASSTGGGGRAGITSELECSSEDVIVNRHNTKAVSEDYRELAEDTRTKNVDTGAATEARRRRRELMKLKSVPPDRFPFSWTRFSNLL